MSKTSGPETAEGRHPPQGFFTWQLTDPLKVERYLWGLSFASCVPQFEQQFYSAVNTEHEYAPVLESDDLRVSTVMCCSLCGAEFESRDDQVQHYKADWHRYNLKQKLMGRLPLTEQTFVDTVEEISSISGSESETGGESATDAASSGGEAGSPRRRPRGSPARATRERSASVTSTDTEGEDGRGSRMNSKVYLKNGNGQVLALYRCIIHGKLAVPSTHDRLVEAVSGIPGNMRWAVVMVGGGHFAAAIYDGGSVVAHKTFHRYTVRAKQGSSQSSRDGKQKGSRPKSAGASLRRHNETALAKDVRDLLLSWSAELDGCSCIFYRAPGASRACLFSGKSPPFDKSDPRLRPIPFPTRRATYKEVLRVHRLLATVECFGSEASLNGRVPASPKVRPRSPKKSCGKSPEKHEEGQKSAESAETVPEEASDRTDEERFEGEGNAPGTGSAAERGLAEEPIGTLGSRESASAKGRSRGRRKRGKGRGAGRGSSARSAPSEYRALRTALFEACQSGNLEALSRIVKELAQRDDEADAVGETRGVEAVDAVSERGGRSSRCDGEDRGEIGRVEGASRRSRPDDVRLRTEGGEALGTDDVGSSKEEQRTPQNEDETLPGTLATVPRCRLQISTSDRRDYEADEGEGVPPPGRLRSPTGSDPDATPVVEREVGWDRWERRELLDTPVDDSGTTLLHYCSARSFHELVKCLLEAGADPTLRNAKGQSPYAVASDRRTRREFCRFRASRPYGFDYDGAQIPLGLTEEMEKERSRKIADKQKEKRKLHREKLKERKAAEALRRREEEERQRFLALSDREKRALMAERRFAQQLLATDAPYVVSSRCFACAVDITGKVPFEYDENKFCSVDCVKRHRRKNAGDRL